MDQLIKLLRSFEATDVFNPWRHADPLDAIRGGARRRIERLRAHFDCAPALILVGEAPGYQGCHFSGIPFTNEKLILDGAIPRVSSDARLTTRERPWCEPSATIVWRTLHRLGLAERTILWNTFAWHPYKAGNPLSNRTPARRELDAGRAVLRAVLEHFDGVPVVPVGQIAARTLTSLAIPTLPPVRHPSMGGATQFAAGVSALVHSLPGARPTPR
jgi:uracil-DNA glycosylase